MHSRKRVNDDDDDDDQKADKNSQTLSNVSHDVLNKIFFLAVNSVQTLIRLCGVDKRFRALCADEYVWLHMYFLKVRGKNELSQITNAHKARQKVKELHETEGKDWETAKMYALGKDPKTGKDQPNFATALVALLWHRIASVGDVAKIVQLQIIEARTKQTARMTTSASVPGRTVFWRDWQQTEAKVYRPANWRQEMVMETLHEDLFQALFDRRLKIKPETRITRIVDNELVYRIDIPQDENIHLFVLLLQLDFIPSLQRNEPKLLPTMFTEACISCGFPAALVQCGADCGRAHYCDQACADAHWETHRTNCRY